jgi:hypothetical protein
MNPLKIYLISSINLVIFGQDSAITYNRDIRPILSDACFHCHGPDKSSRKAGLRLDIPEEAYKMADSGLPAITPKDPEQSEIYKRMISTDQDDMMPPPEAHKILKKEEIQKIKSWIEQGAVYEPHWAYTQLVRPKLPIENKHPIDSFVQKWLNKKKIAPSAIAEMQLLMRRLYLDIIGLPPSPEQVSHHIQQNHNIEQIADELLKSPHYGERMA